MRKLLAVLVALLLILIAVDLMIVDHNRSKWGYQVGDFIEYKNTDGTNWTTTKVVNIEPVDVVLEEKGYVWGNYIERTTALGKFTPFLFSGYEPDPHDNITHLPDESVALPWGAVTCHVVLVESPPYNYQYKYWEKNGVVVKGMGWGGYLNLTDEWQLVGLSPHLRFAYLGLT